MHCTSNFLHFTLNLFVCSQSRGINIPLSSIFKFENDEDEIRIKYWKRKGFSKAYDEMNKIVTRVVPSSKANLAIEQSKNKNVSRPSSKIIGTAPSRRSPRLEKRDSENSCSTLSRSSQANLAIEQSKNKNVSRPSPKIIETGPSRRSPRIKKPDSENSCSVLRRSTRIQQKLTMNK